MIHICYTLFDKDGRYSKFTGTSILSVFEILSYPPPLPVTVHLLHDNTLTQDNRDKFIQLAKNYKQTIKFYNLEEICPDKIEELEKSIPTAVQRYSIATFYKFFIVDVLPLEIKKVLYFDSDVIINLDINKLWKVNLDKKTVAAIPEVESYVDTNIHLICRDKVIATKNYFNAGVVVIDTDKLRYNEKSIRKGLEFLFKNPQYDCGDQEVWNYCFSENYMKLPKKFNTLVEFARMNDDFETDDRICHYITSSHGRGFGLDTNDAYNKLFLKYFIKTPWFNEESIGRLYNEIVGLYNGRQNFATQVSAIMSGKQRAFFVSPQNIDTVKKIFYVNPNEEIIPATNIESLQNLFVLLKRSGGRKIFFLLVDGFPAISELLTKAGFVEGRDFINGMAFLSNAHGVNMNPYPLVKAM